ncbi:MAG: hypothetical protein JWN88_3013 [Frankiales bacterium]|nr:hypothetical protein [Frankiales bacterium]
MRPDDRAFREAFGTAVSGGPRGVAAADRLCDACVELLDVDGAALSIVGNPSAQGTYGASSDLSRRLDEFQFTLGEGPCMDSVRLARPVLIPDLDSPLENRWPVFAAAVLGEGVRAVFAIPVAIATSYVGALDLFRRAPGPLSDEGLTGGLLAAQLGALPLLDMIAEDRTQNSDSPDDDGWSELATLARVEVYQATGMLMAQLDVGPAEALVRLRAHAFAEGVPVSQVAWRIIERELTLEADPPHPERGAGQESAT